MNFLKFFGFWFFFIASLRFFVYKEQDVSLPFLNYHLKYHLAMEKFYNKTFRAVAILLMLSTSQLGVTYSSADSEEDLEQNETQKNSKLTNKSQKEGLEAILTEKMVNGKLEVKQFALPKDTTKNDMNRILSLEGTSGWSYVNSKAYHSGIVLFDGKVSKDGEKYWKISINGLVNQTKERLDLQSSGKPHHSSVEIDKNFSSEDLDYKVVFSGKMIKSDKGNVVAIAFTNLTQNSEQSQNIKLLQFENLTSELVNSIDCNHNVRNSFW